MANRKWNKLQMIGHDRKIAEGSFAPDGVNQPTDVIGSGILTATRFGVGQFGLVFDAYSTMESAVAQLHAAANNGTVQIGTSGIIQVAPFGLCYVQNIWLVNAAGAAQDLAANINNRIHFRFVFRNSTRR